MDYFIKQYNNIRFPYDSEEGSVKKMGILKNAYFKLASEDMLRKKSDKIFHKLGKLDYNSKNIRDFLIKV